MDSRIKPRRNRFGGKLQLGYLFLSLSLLCVLEGLISCSYKKD